MKTLLTREELNKRCDEVFVLEDGDYILDIEADSADNIIIHMIEEDSCGRQIEFDYKPDMSERPEAVAYLMGERTDFND